MSLRPVVRLMMRFMRSESVCLQVVKREKGQHDRTPIMSLVSPETGEVRSQVIANVRGETLREVLRSHTDPSKTHFAY